MAGRSSSIKSYLNILFLLARLMIGVSSAQAFEAHVAQVCRVQRLDESEECLRRKEVMQRTKYGFNVGSRV